MSSPDYVARPAFDQYREQFKKFVVMERRNGIILLRMHLDGGPVKWNWPLHNAIPQAFHVVGNDPENEVMIFTGTGEYWVEGIDADMKERDEKGQVGYDQTMYDATRLVENFLFEIDIPTIGVVNGPGYVHTEMALMSDITLCSDDTWFQDPHFPLRREVPGDGLGISLQGLLGPKRSAYYMYTGKRIDAKTALDWGLVNEVLPREKLLDRAWELAGIIMQAPRVTRRLTSQMVRRPWQRLVMDDFRMQMAYEFYAHRMKGGTSWGAVKE